MTLTCTQTLMDIGIENKMSNETFHPFMGNFCSSLLSVLDFFLPLLSPLVTVTWFILCLQNHQKISVVFWGGGVKKYRLSVFFPRSFPMVIPSHGLNPTVFFCRVCCIPFFFTIERRLSSSFIEFRLLNIFLCLGAFEIQ